ncbi:MAG: PIN domain-containing protein [Cyanobacteria bacterium P01_F01_bin.56]
MRYLLDTNTCIAYLNGSSVQVAEKLIQRSPDDLYICDIVKFELYFGAYKSTRTEANLKPWNSFSVTWSVIPLTKILPRFAVNFGRL